MKLTDLDLNLLVAFEALAAEGSVTRAARRLGIGQPAMSDALRRLRLVFADPLFVRAGSGMRMTDKAAMLAPEIAALLDRARLLVGERAPFDPAQSSRSFAIASTDYTTLVLLPGLVGRLSREAPGVALRIVAYDKDELPAMLDSGAADIAFGVLPDAPGRMVRTALFGEHFVGVARAGHPALPAEGAAITAETYAALPHALVSVRRDATGAIDTALAAQGLSRRIALVLPYMLLLPDLLMRSDMVSALPARAARRLAAAGALVTFPLPVTVPAWEVSMVWGVANRADRGLAWLRGLAAASAKDLAADLAAITPSDAR